jgi:hypothetical protein
MTNTRIRIAVKGASEAIIDGEWFKKIKTDDSMWSLESDGSSRTVQLTI